MAPPPARTVTRERIADAALLVLEREGLTGLSMRKVAAEIGVQAASLYWHVRNKEELLDLLNDAIIADAELPPRTGDWRHQYLEYGRRYRALLLAKRDAAKVVAGRLAPGPHILAVLEDQLDRLRGAGFTDADAAMASYLLSAYVQGFVLQEQSPLSATEAAGAGRGQAAREAGDTFRALAPDTYPNLVALADDLTDPDMNTRFEFGLQRLADGLATRLPK
ncbi:MULTISPECIES: TetR/AcrR family transcriptional regulator [Kitasatospora]|uniref:Putative TetR family transcriptional regulator n=1 Tax=Kitasatospora setae (strain ATCC 33774 / DSM 43861 / JCM 3304 / KCC A-0304 / NBRC 14216 / KM-6054) TaxID=452652 RepID=E4NA94_KITSK|nr:TetR/AcrR family transcriptional regulator [Kitasatospora setae]BAJ28125.1 putative TetR family transcriptional regulator [Kitasatospora setae KM-6054]